MKFWALYEVRWGEGELYCNVLWACMRTQILTSWCELDQDSIAAETNAKALIRDGGSLLCVRYINTAIKWRRVFRITARADWLLITNAPSISGLSRGTCSSADYRRWQTTRFLLDFVWTHALPPSYNAWVWWVIWCVRVEDWCRIVTVDFAGDKRDDVG